MESKIKFMGHPVHQMLVAFPLGAFGFSVAADTLHTFAGDSRYADAAEQSLDFAIASAALAAPFGLVDWLAIPSGTRAKRIGLWHAVGNGVLLGLLATSRWMRSRRDRLGAAKYLSGAGFVLSGVTAWLGGELVDRHGIGVSNRAALEAPSSLDKRGTLEQLPEHAFRQEQRVPLERPEPLPR